MEIQGNDTIAAISTAVSEGGIGIIRISGGEAFRVADRVFRGKKGLPLSKAPSHTIHYGHVYEKEEPIDEVLASVFRAPRSFTAEDTVELNCHGGVYAMRRVLRAVLHAGARPAQPGEFTKRAFLNGRIDLSQAEAVSDVIRAKNEDALRSSLSQLRGSVHLVIDRLRGEILYEMARIESALDDPEHYTLDDYGNELLMQNDRWLCQIQTLIDTAEDGRLIREGISTVIAGKPNVGKSSLLNGLLEEERAIVTEIAGTTRDVLTETMQLSGITLNIMDTAGIRETKDQVEKIGVDRAKKSIREADLVLFVVDGSRQLDQSDREIARTLPGKRVILLINKSDLPSRIRREDALALLQESGWQRELPPVLEISAGTGKGIDRLEKTITSLFHRGDLSFNEQVIITNMRQVRKLEEARDFLLRVKESIGLGLPEDFFTIDLRGAYESLGEITGETAGEDLINEIFEKFCMGK